jgi:5-methylcytosine-specific restriction endonuclease McrA
VIVLAIKHETHSFGDPVDTLVLSQGYAPLHIVSWQKAVTMFFDGKVEVVSEYDEDIRSVSLTIKMPAVVRLVRAHRLVRGSLSGPRFTRSNVLLRDDMTCQYCGLAPRSPRELSFDHVLPRARGGRTCWENIVTACLACNTRKGCKTPEEARMKLRRVPVRPRSLPFFHARMSLGRGIPEAWKSWVYWNGTIR